MYTRKMLFCFLCIVLLQCLAIPAYANSYEYTKALDSSLIEPMMTYIASASCNLTITSNGLAHVESNITGYSNVTSVRIVASLQRYSNGQWSTIKSWIKTADSNRLTLYETQSVSKGYSYRVVSTVTAYSGLGAESRTLISGIASY